MQVNKVTETEFSSMFGNLTEDTKHSTESPFSFSDPNETMFYKKEEEKIEEKEEEKVENNLEEKVETPLETKEEEKKEEGEESIFIKEEVKTPTATAPGLKEYFESRINEGKFLGFQDGKLETPEDIDDLIEANFAKRIEEIQDEVKTSTYSKMTPAWRFIAENSEKFSNPADLLPLIQGVATIDTISTLNPEDDAQAETIVRAALRRRNEPVEIVEEQINLFKEQKTLSKLAKQYKPILVGEENQKMALIQKQREAEIAANEALLKTIHENALKNIETPFLGKHKLKQEEKAAIYDLIADPTEESGGYKIFQAIDNLYENKDFDTLREIALLLTNKDSYRKYMGITVGTNLQESLMRKLKTTNTSSTSFENEEPTKVISKKPAVAQNRNTSGFGFFTK